MWDGFYPAETDRALRFRADNPLPTPAPKVNGWAQAGEILAAPFKGAAQGAVQSARVLNTAVRQVGVSGIDPREDPEGYRAEQELSRAGAELAEPSLRRGAEAFAPDPKTSTEASELLHGLARVVTKAGGYAVAAGAPGAIVGTALDEGITGALELTDKGVDTKTAAKVGAVRSAVTAASVALPVVGATVGRTMTLLAAGGPASFMAEQSASRAILERANYPELAQQYDPFDPKGLLLSVAIPGAIAGGIHLSRARASRAAAVDSAVDQPARTVDAIADVPEIREAAHVDFAARVAEAHMLGPRDDLAARDTHARAVETAQRAMEAGEPIRIDELRVDPVHAARVADDLHQRLQAVRETIPRTDARTDDALPFEPMPTQAEPNMLQRVASAVRGDEPVPRQPQTPVDRANAIAQKRPDLPVRMEDDGAQARPASDVLLRERHEAQHAAREARTAFETAIECFLKVGTE
jgi:hypothetical protein